MNKSLIEKRNILAHAFCSTIDVTKNNHMIAFNVGFELGVQAERERSKILVEALEFYSLKSNYSVVDEGRNYSVEYVTYELDENTYADMPLGTRARISLEKYKAGGE